MRRMEVASCTWNTISEGGVECNHHFEIGFRFRSTCGYITGGRAFGRWSQKSGSPWSGIGAPHEPMPSLRQNSMVIESNGYIHTGVKGGTASLGRCLLLLRCRTPQVKFATGMTICCTFARCWYCRHEEIIFLSSTFGTHRG